MRFLHTADWHLGRIFHQTHLTEDQAYVLAQLIDLIKEIRPDALLISGDIYDRGIPPQEAVSLLDDTLSQIIIDHQTPIIMLAGNHDSSERLNFGGKLLARQKLHVAGILNPHQEPVVLYDEFGPVYFLPIPYAEPAFVKELFQADRLLDHEAALSIYVQHFLPSIPSGTRSVALAHAFVTGGQSSDSERQLSVGGSSSVSREIFAPFNYTALGHLHSAQKISPSIRYSGSLLKYSFAEAHQPKGVNLVSMNGAGNVEVEQISLTPHRDLRVIEGFFADLIKDPLSDFTQDYLLIRLKDAGPVLDPVGRLRQVYPYVLGLERTLFTAQENAPASSDYRKLTDDALFASFYKEMTNHPLSSEQEKELALVLTALEQEEKEGLG